MRATRTAPPLLSLLLAAALAAAGCNNGAPTTPTPSGTKKPVGISKSDDPGDKPPTTPAATYFGRVLALDGKPAAGIEVRATIIANHGGSLVTDNGAGLVTDNGAGLISNNTGNYRLAQAAGPIVVKTDAEGRFSVGLAADQTANLEAVQSDEVKAIKGGITAKSTGVDLQLAYTGSIAGKVTTPPERKITNYTGVDIFIPGTSYAAKAAADGSFTISNIPVGTYKLFATKTGVGQAVSAAVTVKPKEAAAAGEIPLALEPLTIKAVAPATAVEGQEVTITGEKFGASTGGTLQVLVGGITVANPQRDSDTQIRFTVPAALAGGQVTVLVDGLPSDGKPLAIAKDFTIAGPRAGVALPAGPQALTITAHDAAGASIAPPPLTWSIPAGSEFASVDQTGKLTPLKAGQPTIRAAAGALVADLKLKVLAQAPAAAGTLGGVASDLLGTLGGLAVAPDGALLVANWGNVLKFTAGAAAPTVLAGTAEGKEGTEADPQDGTGADASFVMIAGLAPAADGTLWVCDQDVIRKIGPTGEVTTVAGDAGNLGTARDGTGTAAILGFAAHPAILDGQLYFTDDLALRRLDLATDEVKTVIKETDLDVTGLAVGDGKLYVLMGGDLYTLDGAKLTAVPAAYRLAQAADEEEEEEEEPLEAAEEDATDLDEDPGNLVRAADGTFYATAGATIVKRVGKAWTVVAGGSGDVPKDGAGTQAGFSAMIEDLAIGPDGALYVLDEGAVRKVDVKAAGVPVTTVLRSGSDLLAARAKKPAQK